MGTTHLNQFKRNPEADLAYNSPSKEWSSEHKAKDFARRLRKVEKFKNLSDDQIEEIRYSLRLFSILTYQSLSKYVPDE